MIRINLLPFRAARKKENVRRQISIFFLSLILVTILTFIYNFMLSKKINGMERKIEDTKTQLAKYNKINQEIEEIKNTLAVLNKKINVIKSLDLNRKEPAQLLQSMSELIVPNRMWLTKLSTTDSSVQISGVAVDNQTVADYMTRLENSEFFDSVKLGSIKKLSIQNKKSSASDKNMSLMSFGLSFHKTNSANPEGNKAKSGKSKEKAKKK